MVAIIPVGMSHVASVNLSAVVGTAWPRERSSATSQFGGSDIIILFQEGVDAQVDTDPEPRRVGSVVARAAGRNGAGHSDG